MDFIFELLFELLFEGVIEIGPSPRIPRWIRYPLIILLFGFYGIIMFLMMYVGINCLFFKKDYLIGILLIALTLFIGIGLFVKIRNTYIYKRL